MSNKKTVAIIGGGPAGLTAAYELLKHTDFHPIIIEKSDYLGGISRTVQYKGNRIDIGGHRFFSKSDRVMNWWLDILPVEKTEANEINISYQNKSRKITTGGAIENPDEVMLVRKRKSRIYFKRSFFDYPITLSLDTIKKLGLFHTMKIGISYVWISLFPIKKEENLEQFFINRFGKVLYKTFFKSYTEKVWGVKCTDISADWGAQRIKGLSITKSIVHFIKKTFGKSKQDISQKGTETSLIEYFLYPKFGPGQMWEVVGRKIQAQGGKILMQSEVVHIHNNPENQIEHIKYKTSEGKLVEISVDYLISTMPIKDLISDLQIPAPETVEAVSAELMYRDFITVGVLLKKLKTGPLDDNWIYVQEPDVKVGRLQIFNNWSPFLVKDPSKTWIGMEYFCFEGDEIWEMTEEQMKHFAIDELVKMNLIDPEDALDSVVIKMPKTYPAYFGVYEQFDTVESYLKEIKNLYPVGRNGMHKYNNQDHSMLTAMAAVEHITTGKGSKADIWDINTEQEYHEEK
ncbi:NAD(P)/FAD-dependent oxidoreductase [Bacteroidia bacterium]|nr:NAD(P)/FAD-dependent oxidoreductase [Bacteroidia bacterium]